MNYTCTGTNTAGRLFSTTVFATSTRDAYLAFVKRGWVLDVTVTPAPVETPAEEAS